MATVQAKLVEIRKLGDHSTTIEYRMWRKFWLDVSGYSTMHRMIVHVYGLPEIMAKVMASYLRLRRVVGNDEKMQFTRMKLRLPLSRAFLPHS